MASMDTINALRIGVKGGKGVQLVGAGGSQCSPQVPRAPAPMLRRHLALVYGTLCTS